MTVGETMHRGRIFRHGAAAGALACALTMTALAQERLKDYELTVPLVQNHAGLSRWLDRHGADGTG